MCLAISMEMPPVTEPVPAGDDLAADYSVRGADQMKKLYIEPTSRCNLRCKMCFRNTWIDEKFADMDADVFDAILTTMPKSVEVIVFGGMGEPLAHPGMLEMITRAGQTGKKIQMITNVMLLTPEISQKLLELKLDRLWVSVDAFNKEAYESIRKNGSLSHIERNLGAFNKWKQVFAARTSLGINFVAMKDNVGHLKNLPEFMKRFHVDEVNISNLIPSDKISESQSLCARVVGLEDAVPVELPPKEKTSQHNAAKFPVIHLPLMDRSETAALDAVSYLAENFGGRLELSADPDILHNQHCRFIDEGNVFVRHDGEVCPCMGLLHSHTTHWLDRERVINRHSFGNVLIDGLDAIWGSDQYSRFRDRVRNFSFSPCMRCAGCDLWEQNEADCFGNEKPVCGACLWSMGVIRCP